MAPLRVLVVDDSPVIMKLMEVALQGIAAVETYTDPQAALAVGLSARWDLAIVDMSMPSISGVGLATEWHRSGAGFPVMVLSGHEVPEEGVPDEICAWVTKPFSPTALRDLVLHHATQAA